MKLDALDSSILGLLLEDARLSYREIAAKTGSTTPTISTRIKNLEDLGIIRGYRLELNPDLLGGPPRLLDIHVRPSSAGRIANVLAATPGVERVDVLAGGRILAFFRERQHQGVGTPHLLLSAEPDIDSYQVAEILATPRNQPSGLDPGGADVPCHQCKGPIHGAPLRTTLDGRVHVFCCAHCLETFKERTAAFRKDPRPVRAARHRH